MRNTSALSRAVPANVAPAITLATGTVTGAAGQPFNLGATVADDGKPTALTLQWQTMSGPGNVSFGGPTVASTTGTASPGGAYVLRLSASDGAVTTVASVSASITQTYSGWTNQYGLTGANALDGANPAGDGVSNLSKYAFGMNPTLASVNGLPTLSQVIGRDGKRHLTITYRRRQNSSAELTYTV